jgi:DNA end-binding protein Ku
MHAIWKGSISFGLVNIPIKMLSASQDRELKFVLLHKEDQSQIRYARICKLDGKEVPWKDIVKGYEYQPGEFVVLSQEDFDKVNLQKTKTLEIIHFVGEEEVDPIYFVKPYYLEPEKGAMKTYALLLQALIKSNKVGIAKYVIHNREHLGMVKPYGDMLVLVQLRYQDELIKPKELELPKNEKPSPKELQIALQLIDQHAANFNLKNYKDTYVDEIKDIIEKKAKGKKIHVKGKEPAPSKVQDIMSLLKASLKKPSKKTSKAPLKKTA